MAEHYDQLALFLVVAQQRSFTRAAAQLGISQPALSRAMRNLEERLGVRLLARTTRSVSPTEAGEHLLRVIAPRLEEIDSELTLLSEFRDKPAGRLRITAGEHAAITVMQPALTKLLPDNPDIHIEVAVDYGLTDIVAEGYDAGVRLGEQVAKDMIAMRVGPDMRMAVVSSPAYFVRHARPKTPRDLTGHNCIGIRLPTYGGVCPWEFDSNGCFWRNTAAHVPIASPARAGGEAQSDPTMYPKSYAGSEDGLIENPLTAGPALPKWCTPHFSGRPSRVNIAAIGIPFIGRWDVRFRICIWNRSICAPGSPNTPPQPIRLRDRHRFGYITHRDQDVQA